MDAIALTVAELNTRLTADTKNLEAGLRRARSDVQGFASSGTAALGSFKGALAGLAAASALRELTGFFAGAVKGASDLAEAANATGVAFGQATPQVTAWANNLSAAFGATKTEALTAAAQFQLVTKSAGLTGDQITDLAERAFDLGSVFNVSAEEVSRAVKSGLVGEIEPLRRFGVILNQDKIEAEALRMGLIGLGDEMSAGEKQAATYSLIMRETAFAQGDAENTANSAAGQMRQLRSQMDELTTNLGAALLPAFVKVAGFLNDNMIPAFNRVIDVFGDLTGAVLSFAQGASRLLANVFDATGVDSWAESLRGGADAISDMRDNAFEGHTSVSGLNDELVETNAAGGAANSAMGDLSAGIDDVGRSAKTAAEALEDLTDAKIGVKDAAFALKDAQIAAADAQKELNDLLATGGVDADKLARATEDLAAANETLTEAQETLADAQSNYNDTVARATERHLRDIQKATDDVTKAQQNLADEQQDVVDAEAKLAKLRAQREARDQAIKNARAQLAAADTVTERMIATDALNAALGMEVVTDEEIAAAAADVTNEQQDVRVATDELHKAQDALNKVKAQDPMLSDDVVAAAGRLKEADDAVKVATDGVKTATDDLNKAREPSPGFADAVATAEWALEKAEWAVEKATVAHGKAQGDLNKALREMPKSVTTTVTRNEVINQRVNSTAVHSQSAVSGGIQWVDPNFIGPLTSSMRRLPKFGPYSPDQAAAARMLGLPVLHQGGMVPGPRGADVPIMAQAGEMVIPADQAGGMGGRPIIVQLVADGKVIQEILLAHQRRSGALGFN